MKKQMTWTGKNGNEMKIEVEYTATMETRTVNSDGYVIELKDKEPTIRTLMTTYVDGKRLDRIDYDGLFGLVKRTQGGVTALVICGGRMAFAEDDTEHINEYNEMIAAVKEGGKDDSYKKYEADKAAAEAAKKIESAKKTVAEAESQYSIPDDAEARKLEKRYNDVNNEGGDGYVPHIIGKEEYNRAKAIVNATK